MSEKFRAEVAEVIERYREIQDRAKKERAQEAAARKRYSAAFLSKFQPAISECVTDIEKLVGDTEDVSVMLSNEPDWFQVVISAMGAQGDDVTATLRFAMEYPSSAVKVQRLNHQGGKLLDRASHDLSDFDQSTIEAYFMQAVRDAVGVRR
jgi:hypothetical protein